MSSLDHISSLLAHFKSVIQIRIFDDKGFVVGLVYNLHPQASNEYDAIEAVKQQYPDRIRIYRTDEKPSFTLR